LSFRISISDYNFDWVFSGARQHERSHAGDTTREEAVAFYATLGVDAIEMTHAYWLDRPASYAKRVAADSGLPVSCYVFGVDFGKPAADRGPEVDEARRNMDRAAELGAPRVMITPALVKDGIPLEEQRKWVVDGLAAAAEHGARIGVTACIENLDWPPGRPLTGSATQIRDFCAAVNHPFLRAIYDCGATPFVEEDAVEALRAVRPYLDHVHVKNCRAVAPGEAIERYLDSNAGRRYTGTTLDAGVVPVAEVVEELARSAYDGFLLIEYQGTSDPREGCRRNVEYLRALGGAQ
jgi:sugar phosphate isomerase/epimerase